MRKNNKSGKKVIPNFLKNEYEKWKKKIHDENFIYLKNNKIKNFDKEMLIL